MKPIPSDWPRLSSCVFYKDASAMIDWLCDAFGFELRLKVEGDNGQIVHSELTYSESVAMVGEQSMGPGAKFGVNMLSPQTAGSNTQSIMLFVDDVDSHCAQARSKHARIVDEPAIHDYGEDYWADRSYGALDPQGHMWWFTRRVRSQGDLKP